MKPESEKANQQRRDFIKKSTLVGAGVAASTLVGPQAMAAATVEEVGPKRQKGYQMTEHVAAYYKSASI